MKRWKEVTAAEAKVFVAHCYIMGQIKKSRLEDYWSNNPFTVTPFFGKYMSRNRFQEISRNIHLADVRNQLPKTNPEYDSLFRLRPLINMCHKNFPSALIPERELAIDEASCPWKGRGFKVFNPSKPNKYHMKLYQLCESKSGYCLYFHVYTPDTEKDNTDLTKTTRKVVSLLELANCLGKGHHVYMDNFYSSPQLFDELLKNNTHACGTVRANRKGLPKALTGLKLKKGDICYRRKGRTLAIKWHDKRQVFILTTIHSAHEMDVKLNFEGKRVVKPVAVNDYNQFMLGVDLNDQMVGYYSYNRRTRKWSKKLMNHLLDVIMTNAYILYQKFYVRQAEQLENETAKQTALKKILSHREFVFSCCEKLLGAPVDVSHEVLPAASTAAHFPEVNAYQKQSSVPKRKIPARRCVLCSEAAKENPTVKIHSSSFQCQKCKKCLCIGERNCFLWYHTHTTPLETRANYKET